MSLFNVTDSILWSQWMPQQISLKAKTWTSSALWTKSWLRWTWRYGGTWHFKATFKQQTERSFRFQIVCLGSYRVSQAQQWLCSAHGECGVSFWQSPGVGAAFVPANSSMLELAAPVCVGVSQWGGWRGAVWLPRAEWDVSEWWKLQEEGRVTHCLRSLGTQSCSWRVGAA